eukprot:6457904-Amphidinium_carterae.1
MGKLNNESNSHKKQNDFLSVLLLNSLCSSWFVLVKIRSFLCACVVLGGCSQGATPICIMDDTAASQHSSV